MDRIAPAFAMIRRGGTAALVALMLVSCRPGEPDDGNATAANETRAQPERPVIPVAQPPLDREALLIAVLRAASASAVGQDDSSVQRELDGKRFELRIRFGCPASGPPRRGGAFTIRFDPEDRTLRLRASPNIAADHPLVVATRGADVEAVEGFWIGRPWLLQATCPRSGTSDASTPEPAAETPAQVEPPAPVPVPVPRVGIAQFFSATDARTRRRGSRAYESTVVLAEDEQPSAQGYNLVLSGRLRQLPSGKAIACQSVSLDRPPACVISAGFDRVWIERPETRAVLAEWRPG